MQINAVQNTVNLIYAASGLATGGQISVYVYISDSFTNVEVCEGSIMDGWNERNFTKRSYGCDDQRFTQDNIKEQLYIHYNMHNDFRIWFN